MRVTIDGNEAAASVAYRLNEVCCIYPITPVLADGRARRRVVEPGAAERLGHACPAVVEMQSEGGAAGALHGALQGGALATTFTASQGLLLMIPNMYKIAGELTAGGAARRRPLAGGAGAVDLRRPLRRDGGAPDGLRAAGVGLGAGGPRPRAGRARRDARDARAVRALLRRLPHLARAEHDRAALRRGPARARPRRAGRARTARGRSRPSARSSAARRRTPTSTSRRARRSTRSTRALPAIVAGRDGPRSPSAPAAATGLVDYSGHPEAERVLVRDGLGRRDRARDGRTSLAAAASASASSQVRLYRPFPAAALVAALPPTVRRIAVLDRTKEPGSLGEPLFLDVVAALAEAHADGARALMPRVIGGRYGLSSKEFTPGMVGRRVRRAGRASGRAARFTIGINDDVSGTSLPYDASLDIEPPRDRARGVLRSRLGRHGRREQEHDQDPRRRRRPARPGLLRLRLEEVGLADGLAPALRAPSRSARRTWSRRRASSAATSSACSSASRCSTARPTARRCCSTPPSARRGLGRARASRSRSRCWPSGSSCTSIDAGRIAREAGPPGTHQHRPADLLLRDLRRARARARRSTGSRTRSPRPTAAAARRSSQRNQAAVDRALDGLHRVAASRARQPPHAGSHRSCRPTRPSSCGR